MCIQPHSMSTKYFTPILNLLPNGKIVWISITELTLYLSYSLLTYSNYPCIQGILLTKVHCLKITTIFFSNLTPLYCWQRLWYIREYTSIFHLFVCSLRKWKYVMAKKNHVRDYCRFWLYYTQNMKKRRFSKSVCVCVTVCL